MRYIREVIRIMKMKMIGIIICMMLLITSLSVSASFEEELNQSDYLLDETEEILLLNAEAPSVSGICSKSLYVKLIINFKSPL